MLLTENVSIKIMNKSQYIHLKYLGYNIEYKQTITIPIEHLSTGSTLKVKVKCDICGNEKELTYSKYIKNISKYNIYTCNEKCARIKNKKTCLEKYGNENYNNVNKMLETSIKNGNILSDDDKNIIRNDLIENGKKLCISCNDIKELNRFSKNIRHIDGYLNICKDCFNERKHNHYIDNIDNMLIKNRILKNNYTKNNKEKVNEQQRNYYHNKFKHTNKHQFIWRSMLSSTLRRFGKKKEGYTIDLLGYSAKELKEHIETLFLPTMTWDNHGTEWHIDHIKPVSSFDKNTDVKIVCSLSNLQPLFITTREIDGIIYEGNLNKGKKYE